MIAGIWLRERISRRQLIGIGIAVAGLTVIAAHRAQVAALLPVVLTLCGALGWAIGNICSRQARASKPLHLTLWMSVIPPVPMFIVSLAIEGPARIALSLSTALTAEALPAVLGLLYIVLIATLGGYGVWNWLLSRHPSSVVAPFSMLVPVVGVLTSWLAFGEVIDTVESAAGFLVIGGVLFASRPPRRTGVAAVLPAPPTRESGPTSRATHPVAHPQ